MPTLHYVNPDWEPVNFTGFFHSHGAEIFRFVVHERVLDYARLGWWIVETDLGHHSEYAVLMQWLCDCKVVEPCT